jgi:hypothetical protein
MPQIEASVTVSVTPDRAFSVVDFFGDGMWIPGTARCEVMGTGVGALRQITTSDGARIKEKLESYDTKTLRYSYSIVEAPMPLDSYLSTVEVKAEGAGARITWKAVFSAPQATEEGLRGALEGLFQAAVAGLKTRFA